LPPQNPPPQSTVPVPAHTPSAHLQQLLGSKLERIIHHNKLYAFYPPQRFHQVMQKVMQVDFAFISKNWRISLELAYDLAILALYDVVLYCDDSGSMAFEQDGRCLSLTNITLFSHCSLLLICMYIPFN
jgi:hypothetical protein